MTIKKTYQDLITHLENNKQYKVKTILPDIIKLCSAKSGGASIVTFIKGLDGVVTHIFCYYHKKWESVTEVEFGIKTNSASGFSNMCKEGTSRWTKQQRVAKSANSALLDDIVKGSVSVSDLTQLRANIETKRNEIIPREDGHGTDVKLTGKTRR